MRLLACRSYVALFPTLALLVGCAVAPADDGTTASSASALIYRPSPFPHPLERDQGVTLQYTNSMTGAATSSITLGYDASEDLVFYPAGALVASYTIWDDIDQVASVSDCEYKLFAASGPYAAGPVFLQETGPILCAGAPYASSVQIPADALVNAFDLAAGAASPGEACTVTNNRGTTVTFTSYLFAGVEGLPSGSSTWLMAPIVGTLGGTAPNHPDMPAPSQTLTITLTCD